MGRLFTARLINRLLRMRIGKKPLTPPASANLQALDHLDGASPADSYTYTVVDIETTGLDLKHSRIVSIGAFKITQGQIHLGRMFDRLVNPGRDIPPASITVHGIVPAMVAAAPTGPEALDAFLQYLGSDILVAHNAMFDLNFMNRLMVACHGFTLQNLTIDTRALCDHIILPKLFRPMPRQTKLLGRGAINPALHPHRKSLEEIAHLLGIKVHQRHTAVGDALAAAMIFQRGLAMLKHRSRGRLNDLIRASSF
ncbi:PolC-type DNA polymerase III [Desulfosarcina sp.]|uniref:3'-5' exonuclease n=1 Tax=Desulfosarcina sp. TaxID=2027861 RepID=UPI00356878FE